MKKKKQKKKPRPTAPSPQQGSPSFAAVQHERIIRIGRDFLVGIFLSLILIGCKWALERSQFCKQIEQMTYNVLQLNLLCTSGIEEPKVIVVDINDLPFDTQERGKVAEMVTPREPLKEIVKAVAEQHPKAIGIDIDFSPDEFGYISKDDPNFFDFCLNIREKENIPIFLGIYGSLVLGPEKWLGRPQFKDMAAYIAIPNSEETQPTTKMIERIQPNNISKPCPSMAFALANTYREPAPSWIGWAVKRADEKTTKEFSASEFLIDYGLIEELIRGRLRAVNATDISNHENALKGKLVLIGRATPGKTIDQFVIPGRGQPIQGIYIHASAVYTLLQAPLYKLTAYGRFIADLLASFILFGSIALIRLAYMLKMQSDVEAHRLQAILTGLVVIIVFLLGDLLVQSIRLIWTDFLLVIGALFLHSPSDRFIRWARDFFPHAWHEIVLQNRKP